MTLFVSVGVEVTIWSHVIMEQNVNPTHAGIGLKIHPYNALLMTCRVTH